MTPLSLDFKQSTRRGRLSGYVLAALAIAFMADAGLRYQSLLKEVARTETRIAANEAVPAPALSAPPVSTEEYTYAQDTVRRLSVPWQALFRALELAHTDRVVLLAIEPDVENGTLSVSGEAPNYLGVLTYVASLAGQESLRQVHLVRHDIGRDAAKRAVSFAVSANWKEAR
jgi:hypothetical protein